jgi:hypothetical protein
MSDHQEQSHEKKQRPKVIECRKRPKPRLCPVCGYAGHYSHDEQHRVIWTCEGCGKVEIIEPIPLVAL